MNEGMLVTSPSNKARVLFMTDRGERHQRSALKSAPPELEVIMRRRPTEEEVIALLPDVDFLISERNQPVTARMIDAAPQLKLIVRLGSLSHDIDLIAARSAGVHVCLQPVVESIYVAEYIVMMALALRKRLGPSLRAANAAAHGLPARRTDENTFSYNWMGFTDVGGLYDCTVAILGMGEIGVELARRLKAFRIAKLLYNKRNPYPKGVERELWLTYAPALDCVKEADVLVSLLPFSTETDRSIHAGTFDLMKRSAVFVHAGSGSTVDEQALAEALRAGKLAGAALDTYEYEPLQPTHSLVQLARDANANLLLTPHTAAGSSSGDRSEDFAEIVRFMRREALKHEIV